MFCFSCCIRRICLHMDRELEDDELTMVEPVANGYRKLTNEEEVEEM